MPVKYTVCGKTVEILRMDIRYLRLTLYEDGHVRLSAPKQATGQEIRAFLEKKTEWLRQKLAQQSTERKNSLLPLDEACILLWGEKYKVNFLPALPRNTWAQKSGERVLDVYVPKSQDPQKFILKKLADEVVGKTEILLPLWQQRMKLAPVRCTVRFMKSRWGSCTPASGKIRLNAWLATRPQECLEYVLVHELCHFTEKNHGSGFYKLLQKFLPDWQERKSRLSQES